MRQEEYIKRYGEGAYEKKLQQRRDWYKEHSEQKGETDRLWRLNHPEEVKATNQTKNQVTNPEINRKGGKYYEKMRKYFSTGIPYERALIRTRHANRYRSYKNIIAPESQIHHEWIPNTSNYRGMALVEKEQHMHGFVDVIQILEGEITLLTEEEIRGGNSKVW